MDFQQWAHMFLCPIPVVHEEEVCDFYSNLQLLKDETLSTMVKGVELTFNAEALGQILRIPTNGFDTYIKWDWIRVYEEQKKAYLMAKFS